MDRLNKPTPLREQVYNALRAELFKGTFKPGQRITEKEIAVSLGVSRTPVREALNLFRKQGIVEQRHGGGYIFCSPTVRQVEDIFEIRRALEPLAARKVLLNCKDADIDRLEDVISVLGDEKHVFNFNSSDTVEIDREKSPWPKTVAEADELWDKRIRLTILNQKLSGKEPEKAREKLHVGL